MKDLGNINITREQIEKGETPKLIHKRKGAIIKLHYYGSGDKYYVEDVIYKDNDFNILFDGKALLENQSGNHNFDELIDNGTSFKEACEELDAEWYAFVNGAHYTCLLK